MSTRPDFDPGFSTAEMTALFSSSSRVDALLEFEAGLALALADVGLAPLDQAEAVATACQVPIDDPERLLASTWEIGTPMIALVGEIRERLPGGDERQWVHYGATSQDAIDTAQMLQARRGLELLETGLSAIATLMLELMESHRSQPQMGRTFLQHARPTTFGIRVAMWLDTTLRHILDLRGVRSGLAVQLGGPVGNLAELGIAAKDVTRALAGRLGLEAPDIAWHADRSRVWALAAAVERAARSMAKIAGDVVLLAQSDTGEITVRSGGSSSMGEKRNPIDAIRTLAAAEVCSGAVATITRGRPHELDRGVGGWHVEWFALPLAFQSAAAVLESMERSLETLTVHTEVMASRVSIDVRETGAAEDDPIDRIVSLFAEVLGDA